MWIVDFGADMAYPALYETPFAFVTDPPLA
jgi:hypothetical protein